MAILKETPVDSFTTSTDFMAIHVRVDNGQCTLVHLSGREAFVGHVPSEQDILYFASGGGGF